MVAYCLSCNIVNTFSISGNSVCSTVIINLTVRSLQHLNGRVGNVRASQRTSPTGMLRPTLCFCLCCRKCVSALSFLKHLPIYSASWLFPFLDQCLGSLWLVEPCSGPGILPLKSFLLSPGWCHVLNHFWLFLFFVYLILTVDCVVNLLYTNCFLAW